MGTVSAAAVLLASEDGDRGFWSELATVLWSLVKGLAIWLTFTAVTPVLVILALGWLLGEMNLLHERRQAARGRRRLDSALATIDTSTQHSEKQLDELTKMTLSNAVGHIAAERMYRDLSRSRSRRLRVRNYTRAFRLDSSGNLIERRQIRSPLKLGVRIKRTINHLRVMWQLR